MHNMRTRAVPRFWTEATAFFGSIYMWAFFKFAVDNGVLLEIESDKTSYERRAG